MSVRTTARWLSLTGVSLLVAVALVVSTSDAALTRADSQSVDTETVSRLTHGLVASDRIQVTTDVTGTHASLLATGLLLDAIFYDVNLPVIMK